MEDRKGASAADPAACVAASASEDVRRRTDAVAAVTRALLDGEDEDAGLQVMTDHAARFAAGDLAVAALTDDVGDLVVRAIRRSNGSPPTADPIGPVGTTLESRAWQEISGDDPPLAVPVASVDAAIAQDAERLGIGPGGTMTVLPVAVGGQHLGLLLLVWDHAAPDVDLSALVNFTQQAALALLAGRAQRDRSLVALLEDRDRIARDMHDHVIQRLFATGLSLQSATRLARHPVVRERLDHAIDELDESIKHIRHTIFELHRPIVSGGLRDQLRSLIESDAVGIGFIPILSIEGSLAGLAPPLESDIVAVVREGLSNVARHARASTARVEITAGDPIVIVIADDGVGADPGVARSGLINLGSRAAARSGRFDVRRGDGGVGTVLRWQVPRERRS